MKRYISTTFWDDEWVQSLDFTEKGLYLYLLTNSLTNIAGVYKLSERRIIYDTGLEKSIVEKTLEKFQKDGKAYRHGEYIVLPAWPHHQKCTNVNIQRGISRILKDLDRELLEFLAEVGYRYPLEQFLDAPKEKKTDGRGTPGTSEEMKLFLDLWQRTKDKDGICIFQITAPIENPKDWNRFWEENKPTKEQIEKAFQNFTDGINSGAIQRRFIPATPDRFVLKGGISRYQEPVQPPQEKKSLPKSGLDYAGKIEL
jgi:hypothetical protein